MQSKLEAFCQGFFAPFMDGIKWFGGKGIIRQDPFLVLILPITSTNDEILGFAVDIKKDNASVDRGTFHFDDYMPIPPTGGIKVIRDDESSPYRWKGTPPPTEAFDGFCDSIIEYMNELVSPQEP